MKNREYSAEYLNIQNNNCLSSQGKNFRIYEFILFE